MFWVHASNAARFEQSYRDIADCVKISGRLDPKANIFKLVHDWLHGSKERWLLVLDNVDDARFLADSQAYGQGQPTGTDDSRTASRPLRTYLPCCDRGSILITTRNKEAALTLLENRDIVPVEPMDKVQALALFEKKLGVQGDNRDNSNVAELAAALEYMPMAIVQAAAYILQRAPRFSVAKYLEEFKKSERKRSSLLTHDGSQLRRDWEAKNSIVVTWQISFEHIQLTQPSAADLLSLMSFFDRQGIPEALIRSRRKHGEAQRSQRADDVDRDSDEDDTSQSSAGDDAFENDLMTLRNFCFISVDTNGTSFEMHALVQLATRMWLTTNGKLEQWKQQFISNLCAVFPTGQYENWAACQALFAHARSAVEQQPEDKSSLAEWATLLFRAAWYAKVTGNIADAVTLAVKSMKARKKMLGQEHEDTLWSMEMVGLANRLGGRWNAAEALFIQVMETRKRVLGEEHLDTLTSMANLASTFWNQGRWKEAEELGVQVMETRKRVLGKEHPDTLTSMANLAFTLKSRSRDEEALSLLEACFQLREQILGEQHPNTQSSLTALEKWQAEKSKAGL